MRVLFVCSANVCRSTMAAGLFVHAVHQRGVQDAFAASAGFLDGERPVHHHVQTVLDERGIDASRKRSQTLSPQVVDSADVILTMTSAHARGLVGRFPTAMDRVYTFRHFATAVTARTAEQPVVDWLRDINSATTRAYASDNDVIDIEDPIGKELSVFVELASELENSISWILDCAYPPVD